jgi:uncharacterized RDD family membrane protein YckC
MSHCPSCQKPFTFTTVLVAMNPASIKCRHCPQLFESSYLSLGIAVLLFAGLCLAFWLSPFSGQGLSFNWLIFLTILGFIFEYGYFYCLDKGYIRSNLLS